MTDTLTPLQRAQAAARLRREQGIAPVRLDPIQKARANPQSKALAIKAKCYDCVGAGHDPNPRQAVRDCGCRDCPLWPVRPWQTVGKPGGQQGEDDDLDTSPAAGKSEPQWSPDDDEL